ncbi:MAG: SsrA-binding protein SmpB [Alphaproteobacteria bacterium]|nr:SsrA-binding protein SmpB [Alphaproteobacteria bacterium]MBR3662287.1 SsrA-binding protein SmpB [Alphaproteobacteria bacterium]
MSGKSKKAEYISTGLVAQNRRAHFDYLIDDTFIAGLVLTGTEVKSLRLGHANINEAYGITENNELYMSNMFIAEYINKGYETHAERRNRKLLLQHREIVKIQNALNKKGATLIAMKLFFDNHGRAKLEIGLGRGKKLYDKRETAKERDWNREKSRLMMS